VAKTNLDTLDYEIVRLLTVNGRTPIGKMAEKFNVTATTVRNRIKGLEKKYI
jgi:DNA-binding Lrp family transcriptional regulator